MGKDAGKCYLITGNNATTSVGVKASGFPKTGDNLCAVVGVAAPLEALLNLIAAGAFVRTAK